MRRPCQIISFLFLFAALTSSAVAKGSTIELGAKAPVWEALKGTDGKEHSFAELQDAQVVVLVFTCNNCPVAQSYEKRLATLAETYRDKSVAMVAINANKTEDIKEMAAYAKERQFPYWYLHDATQEVAKSYGASRTPEVFLLSKDRKVAYMGAIDDDTQLTGQPTQQYLRDAIDAVLADEEPPKTKTRAIGCAIRWR